MIPGLIALASAPSTRHAKQEVQRHRLAGGQHRSTIAKRTDTRETGLHLGAETRLGARRESAPCGPCLPQCERQETAVTAFRVCSEL